MGQYTNDDVCMELTLPADPTVGLNIKIEANQVIKIRVNPRMTIPIPAYRDINGVEIKVGDTVLDWLTQSIPIRSAIESLDHLDRLYVHSWGLLEVVNE